MISEDIIGTNGLRESLRRNRMLLSLEACYRVFDADVIPFPLSKHVYEQAI